VSGTLLRGGSALYRVKRVSGTLLRGGSALHRADLEVRSAGEAQLASSTTFGIRTIELRRTATETRLLFNGKPIYLRGATYWPDLYLSAIDRPRYEHYRMQKYDPNAGYFLFMWIDFCPQSFYGVYDYWGRPKVEGLGGGLRALEESNKPVGIFMEYKDAPVAIHAVNDLLADLGDCWAEWLVTTERGAEVTKGKAQVHLGPDSHARVGSLSFQVQKATVYRVTLWLRAPDGRELARNVYVDPFHHPPRPQGYSRRMDPDIGMRLWWAGEGK